MIKKLFLLLTLSSLAFGATQTTPDIKTRTGTFPAKEMKEQNKKIAKLVSEEISRGLPQKIDKYTSLLSVVAKDVTLLYTFEINTGVKSDKTVQNEDRTRMKKAVTTGICQSSEKFLIAGINTSYIYKSAKSKVELFRFDISQADCVGLVK